MTTPTDPHHVDADYGPLVDALAREGLPRRTEAVRAVEAVACALARRLDDPVFETVQERLPEPFRSRLAPCERHTFSARREHWDTESFYEAVADDLGREGDVEPAVRAVFAAIRAQLPEVEAEELGQVIPEDLALLWRRPS